MDVPLCRHLELAVGRSASHEVEMYFLPPCFTRILIICCRFYRFFKEWDIASGRSPDRDQADPFYAPSRSQRLYDFAPDIQDAMELRALGPNAKIVKVMSVRDSRCIGVLTPDDHVACGFYEILLYDMGEEELPFVATSELDYLRRVWPRAFFAFLTRYNQDFERKRTECKELVGCTQSGKCTHGGKYIQMDFGKHIAFCHLELAWQCHCLVVWCTACLSVRPANSAKLFPARTITREQWADLLLPSISGVAVDTLFFSRMASPPGHRYWLISRTGSQYDAVFSVEDVSVVCGARDIKQVVRRRASPPGGQTRGAAQVDRQHEPPRPGG